ncbi:MAG: ABC transporter ATP-binding protein [Candidatus Levybacteria bacterium]|nr:ABC transporter ATP-binding protein [Candidatus Levybacteria bacterium]
MTSIKNVIQLENIVKNYISDDITTQVLRNITLTIKKGDFIAITGSSGSGKSTLLNIIGLLDSPTSGTYLLNGVDVTNLSENEMAANRSREIGFVFQSFNLLKRATVLDNVILPSIYAGLEKKEREQRAMDLLESVGLKEQVHKKPNQLSGGQQQRVAIARALINKPAIILADEPTGNLDTASGNEVMKIINELNKQGNTIIIITHEHDIALQAKKIITLRDGEIQK